MAIFGLAIGASAFLLFWIEPLIGQLVLPVFGGAPAVWSTVLVFFQSAVLAGYLYSHASVTRLGIRRGAILHVGVLVVGLAWLIAVPLGQGNLRAGELPEALDVLRILVTAIAVPVFVLTSTTPLLSAWLAASRRPGTTDGGGGDPYRLYAVSNAASLGALLAYPFILGPSVGLSGQGMLWSVAFGGLAAVLAITAAVVLRRPRDEGSDGRAEPGLHPSRTAASTVGWSRRARWILLAAAPSGLLAAVTNFIAADLIAAPLLWIGPLALYLGSFVVAFSARGQRIVSLAITVAPAAITLMWTPLGSAGGWPILPFVLLLWGCLAVVATALHGRLAADRPPAARLTEFYLVQSVGGVTGGVFVAIVAPLAFEGIWEYPILLVAALVALALTADRDHGRAAPIGQAGSGRRPALNLGPFFAGGVGRLVPFLVIAAALTGVMAFEESIALPVVIRWFLVGGLVLLVGGSTRFLAVTSGVVLVLATFVLPNAALLRDRSFFGVTEVVVTGDGRSVQLMHGTTVHGVQATDPALRQNPSFYYARSGPLGDVFGILHERSTGADIAVLGLGAGGIAAYERASDSLTFFEIDPVVIRVATDTRYFTYLSDAPVRPRLVLGDARRSLRIEPSGSLDLLILDAFSSDAIPSHLLTIEALLDDQRVLRPDGMLVLHVSNRYYDLAPALGAAADRLGMIALERRYNPTAADLAAGAVPSVWVMATSDTATAARFRAAGWSAIVHDGVVPITDDHPDVLRFLQVGR